MLYIVRISLSLILALWRMHLEEISSQAIEVNVQNSGAIFHDVPILTTIIGIGSDNRVDSVAHSNRSTGTIYSNDSRIIGKYTRPDGWFFFFF